MAKYMKEGDGIGRIMVIEFSEQESFVFDEIMTVMKHYPDFEGLWIHDEEMLSLPGLKIDPVHRKVYCGNQEISLTVKEYDLLCLFAVNKGRTLTYDWIYQKVWREEAFGNTNNAIACHVHNLREKIGRILPKGCFVIRCVREVGYCLEEDSECIATT